uniref:Choline transporter-like protein n=1 Tax=Polytomella parva TaxID=51329 RepID=A0A7S0UT24_9CHLO|mmetsp:Transcript_2094/g.3138  ORF Transcript_2094/g.3138 Transcript_2094/m.3138 type:complete len:758 (+) Transcript_2094:121-2394(+)|eukprot:CAMPEP_0175050896 /NCGR_PEP_ID=MMETSP0052_2-20121109/7499_1 /TAXON_ID=51329 ORGANISM="Polytomella parva, Strain SAG 63-3" /NCGR_SAMPLE_ID=MMETSP0052_2 /ASSEMBLY_ACC=CAM_ASM_000194 /LENGTH=757 /DNA_ID=CAMNT_0016315121 /DNA_START=117 /DNA_END=2390 /DNA_ORIENTATION=-
MEKEGKETDKLKLQVGQPSNDPEFQPVANLYNSASREVKDKRFMFTYLFFFTLCFIWSIPTFALSDKRYSLYTSSFFQNSGSCNVDTFLSIAEDVKGKGNHNDNNAASNSGWSDYSDENRNYTSYLFESLTIWAPISAVLSIVFAILYVFLFRKYAEKMVRGTIIVALVLGYVVAILCFIAGAVGYGLFQLFAAIFASIAYFFVRGQLRLCGKLMAISGDGLRSNRNLIWTMVACKVLGVGFLAYFISGFVNALYVGSPRATGYRRSFVAGVVTSEYGTAHTSNLDEGTCLAYDGVTIVPCCTFEIRGWAVAYCIFCIPFMVWSIGVFLQMKLFIVADTIAQWYFHPAPSYQQVVFGGSFDASNSTASSSTAAPHSSCCAVAANGSSGSIRLALTHGFRHSFGSVAFAGLILATIHAIRGALRRLSRNNVLCCVINCFAQPFLAMAEQFTRFATIAVAITGEAFVPAARYSYDLLRRNFLATYNLWWVPDLVLGTVTLLSSFTWAAIVFFITYAKVNDELKDAAKSPADMNGLDSAASAGAAAAAGAAAGDYDSSSNAGSIAFITAFLCWIIVFFVLHFVGTMILDIVNTIYICFAMDLDTRVITRPEVHELYRQIPSIAGAVVENPDGAVMYGNPVTNASSMADASASAPTMRGSSSSGMVAASQNGEVVYGVPAYPMQSMHQPYGAVPKYEAAAYSNAAPGANAGVSYETQNVLYGNMQMGSSSASQAPWNPPVPSTPLHSSVVELSTEKRLGGY